MLTQLSRFFEAEAERQRATPRQPRGCIAQLTMSFWLDFFHKQLFVKLPRPTADFSGQTVIVTGANVGLGREAARQLVSLGAAKVILAVRDVKKGEDAAAEILKSTKAISPVVEVWQVDLTNPASIDAFAERVTTLDRLDAVIQNAGVSSPTYQLVEDTEMNFAVNTVGATLLSLRVLPKLRESATKTGLPGRLTIVGSEAQRAVLAQDLQTEGSIIDQVNNKNVKLGRQVLIPLHPSAFNNICR